MQRRMESLEEAMRVAEGKERAVHSLALALSVGLMKPEGVPPSQIPHHLTHLCRTVLQAQVHPSSPDFSSSKPRLPLLSAIHQAQVCPSSVQA